MQWICCQLSRLTVCTLVLLAIDQPDLSGQTSTTFEIQLDPNLESEPVNGRLFVFLSKRNSTPINGPAWFGPEPFFAKDFTNVEPGDKLIIDDSADSFPQPLSQLDSGEYFVQSIFDHDFYHSNHANGVGNFYSDTTSVDFTDENTVRIVLKNVVKPTQYKNTKNVKFVESKSQLLTDFHGRDVIQKAMVVLPKSYEEQSNRRYPVYYQITGFGGTLKQLGRRYGRGVSSSSEEQVEFIRVFLTGQCKWGHHVYANSANNGPRGDALVHELIPEIDRQFRTIPESTARFLGGHSSGGWSSLWLQVNYPDFFGGVWSTAPDPVDFRDWQGTNLYQPSANVYRDEVGNKRPLARFGARVVAYYQDFTQMDDVLGRGGQIRSFDAVFSPKTNNGQPAYCWDRKTGIVNADILEHWKKYDISLILKENWHELEPKLKSKIHVLMGDTDTFYLEGATIKLKERLEELGSDAEIEIFEGKDHSNLLTPGLRRRIMTDMSKQFLLHHSQHKG